MTANQQQQYLMIRNLEINSWFMLDGAGFLLHRSNLAHT